MGKSEKAVGCWGELMIRLSPPGRKRLLQSNELNMYLAGSEYNVAAGLAQWNERVHMISALPDTVWGEWALQKVRQIGITTEGIITTAGRMGTFLIEEGQGLRSSSVVYDRQDTALCRAAADAWNWQAVFQNTTHFHWSGITPGISAAAAALTAQVIAQAAAYGCFISCDLNYRSRLWQYGSPPKAVMPALVAQTSLLLAGPDAIEIMLGIPVHQSIAYKNKELKPEDLNTLGELLFQRFPNLRFWAMSLRQTLSATDYVWQGYMYTREEQVFSKTYTLYNNLDRVGTGDAFMAGLLKGLLCNWPLQQTVDFAAAAGAFKHYVQGDVLIASQHEIEQVYQHQQFQINR